MPHAVKAASMRYRNAEIRNELSATVLHGTYSCWGPPLAIALFNFNIASLKDMLRVGTNVSLTEIRLSTTQAIRLSQCPHLSPGQTHGSRGQPHND